MTTQFWRSKKALATLGGIATSGTVLTVLLLCGMPTEWAATVAGAVEIGFLVYVLSQGLADNGKEAALIDSETAARYQSEIDARIEVLLPQLAARVAEEIRRDK